MLAGRCIAAGSSGCSLACSPQAVPRAASPSTGRSPRTQRATRGTTRTERRRRVHGLARAARWRAQRRLARLSVPLVSSPGRSLRRDGPARARGVLRAAAAARGCGTLCGERPVGGARVGGDDTTRPDCFSVSELLNAIRSVARRARGRARRADRSRRGSGGGARRRPRGEPRGWACRSSRGRGCPRGARWRRARRARS